MKIITRLCHFDMICEISYMKYKRGKHMKFESNCHQCKDQVSAIGWKTKQNVEKKNENKETNGK